MSFKFNRIYRITLRTINSSGLITKFVIQTPIEIDFQNNPDVEGLQMKAAFTISSEQSGNSGQNAVLQLFNISEEHRTLLASAGETTTIDIQAGYGAPFKETELTNLPVIYSGDLVKASTVRTRDDYVTTILLKSGKFLNESSNISRTFAKGSKVTTVAKGIADAFIESIQELQINNYPLTIKILVGSKLAGWEIKKQWIAEGITGEELTRFLKQYRCDWAIVNNVIYIKEANKDITIPDYTVTLDVENIKGQIQKVDDKSGAQGGKDTPRLKVRTFLEPAIAVNCFVEIPLGLRLVSDTAPTGKYTVVTHNVQLDYRGKVWDSTLEIQSPTTAEEV